MKLFIRDKDRDEKIIEKNIVQNVKEFIMTFGKDFTFVGNQYHLEKFGVEEFPDLLFFNRELAALVCVELEDGPFKTSYLGQLAAYLRIPDDEVRKPNENLSIGIILCKSANKKFVEYVIQDYDKPMGVATYKTTADMDERLKKLLPNFVSLNLLMNVKTAHFSRQKLLPSVIKIKTITQTQNMATDKDEKEVREMLLSVYDKLAKYAHNLTNNSDDIGDLLQETVLRIIEKQDHFTAGTNFLSWSTTVMRNIFINNYRRQQKEIELLSIAREEIEKGLENSKNTPLCTVDTEFLFRHIEQLPSHLKKPILLHLNGYKYEEICEVLSLSMPTVKNRIASAKKILQKQLVELRS